MLVAGKIAGQNFIEIQQDNSSWIDKESQLIMGSISSEGNQRHSPLLQLDKSGNLWILALSSSSSSVKIHRTSNLLGIENVRAGADRIADFASLNDFVAVSEFIELEERMILFYRQGSNSRVASLCKNDAGGIPTNQGYSWSSLLSVAIACPIEGMIFEKIIEVKRISVFE